MNCSICGKKIRWWQRKVYYHTVDRRSSRYEVRDGFGKYTGVTHATGFVRHRKCWPGLEHYQFRGIDYGYTAAKNGQEKP